VYATIGGACQERGKIRSRKEWKTVPVFCSCGCIDASSVARQAFNDAVTVYNKSCEKFPSNGIAGAFNFSQAELLASTDTPEERKTVKVSF